MTAPPDLAALVLGPLEGRPAPDWQRAPTGKWTPAQIVAHLALALDWSAEKFRARRAHGPMARRHDLFVKHPRLGDLTLEEWMRFHVIFSRHHARQIRDRLAG